MQACLQMLTKNGFKVSFKTPLIDEEILIDECFPPELKHFLASAKYNPECMPMDTLRLRNKYTKCFVVSAIPYRKWLEYTDFLNEYSISIIDHQKIHSHDKKPSHARV